LRGSRVGDRCPECGGAVGDSLFLLAKPDVVARALRGVGKSFTSIVILSLVLLGATRTWPPLVATAVLAAASVWRLLLINSLRFRGSIDRLPVIGDRLLWLWGVALLELAAALLWFGSIVTLVNATSPAARSAASSVAATIGVPWFMLFLAAMLQAGRFASALAAMLGYQWMLYELRAQLVLVILCALMGCLAGVLIAMPAARPPTIAVLAVAAIVLPAAGLTTVALMHVANAAEQTDEVWEEAIETPGSSSG
jgi:hypothetical protein